MNCKNVQSHLSAYLDGELCGQDSLQVRDHLGDCADCRKEEAQLRSLKQMLRGLPTYTPSEGFEDRLVSSVMKQTERRARFSLNLDWKLASGLAAAAAIGAFAIFQMTERRMPSAISEQPTALRDPYELDYSRDQMFMAGSDPLSGDRFAIPTSNGKK